jgi:hypothetical protein
MGISPPSLCPNLKMPPNEHFHFGVVAVGGNGTKLAKEKKGKLGRRKGRTFPEAGLHQMGRGGGCPLLLLPFWHCVGPEGHIINTTISSPSSIRVGFTLLAHPSGGSSRGGKRHGNLAHRRREKGNGPRRPRAIECRPSRPDPFPRVREFGRAKRATRRARKDGRNANG